MSEEAYREIPLFLRSGEVGSKTRVSEADYPLLRQNRWHKGSRGYAVHLVEGTVFPMHRVILGLNTGDPREGDHINGNKLDNRRSNLRIVTHAEQMQNLMKRAPASSRFRGVYWDRGKHRWAARVRLEGKTYRLGRFRSEIEAARVADEWRLKNMPYARPDPELAMLHR